MAKKFPEENEIVLCIVKNVLPTSVFVELLDYKKGGVIQVNEIAPGRIRNIRDYVVPKKKIACKVLRIDKEREHIDLSLRRVTIKEKKELLEKHEKEKKALALLRIVTPEAEKIAVQIKKQQSLADFLQEAKKSQLEKFLNKEQIEKLALLLKKTEKKVRVKKKISLSSQAENGIELIKKVLRAGKLEKINVRYIAAPFYSVEVEAASYKEANSLLEQATKRILEEAKKLSCKAEIVEKAE